MSLNNWRDAWVIVKKEIRADKVYLLWNVIFMVYSGCAVSLMRYGDLRDSGELNPFIDFIMLLTILLTGFFFSRRSFNYIKEDSYTHMLFYYRTLPIPVVTVMKSRIFYMGIAFLFNGIILFGTLRLLSDMSMDGFQYAAFIFTWMGYALAINGLFIYFELNTGGRVYMWMTMVMILLVGGAVIMGVINDFSVMDYTIRMSREYSLLSPLLWVVLAAGSLLFIIMCALTVRGLNRRSLRG